MCGSPESPNWTDQKSFLGAKPWLVDEWNQWFSWAAPQALYALGSDLILKGANRATLLVFVGAGTPGEMALAVILAMPLGKRWICMDLWS